jgi:arylsulfatase A-like enzyme
MKNHVLGASAAFVISVIVSWVLVHVTSCSGSTKESGGRPNIVLITLESIRADRLNCEDPATCVFPKLNELAEESVVYENAYSVTSWTLAAHASLFTGLYPTAHQTTQPSSRLDDSYTTIAEILTAEGYQCAGIISGPYLRKEHNLHQGFEYYEESLATVDHLESHGDVTNPGMADLLKGFMSEKRDRRRPFFLFAYFWDPHYDYIPPPPYDRMFVRETDEPIDVTDYESSNTVNARIKPEQLSYVISQYDGEIRWTDHHLGEFLQLLKQEGVWDNTVIIVTSDHGQEFFEHGRKGHKHNVYEESIHVPLVIKYAQSKPTGRESRLVSHIDIFPTIMTLTKSEVTTPSYSHSLLSSSPGWERPIFFELHSLWYIRDRSLDEIVAKAEGQFLSIRKNNYKLIYSSRPAALQLYDLENDRGEKHDLQKEEPRITARLKDRLDAWQEEMRSVRMSFSEGGEAELSEEMIERLRSLGYME